MVSYHLTCYLRVITRESVLYIFFRTLWIWLPHWEKIFFTPISAFTSQPQIHGCLSWLNGRLHDALFIHYFTYLTLCDFCLISWGSIQKYVTPEGGRGSDRVWQSVTGGGGVLQCVMSRLWNFIITLHFCN